jgi:hypothetical protein
MTAAMLMEILIAAGSVVVVVGAIGAILFRVTRGNAEADRLDKLKAEFAQKKPAADKGD